MGKHQRVVIGGIVVAVAVAVVLFMVWPRGAEVPGNVQSPVQNTPVQDTEGGALEGPENAFPNDVPRRVSLSGTYVCLPHRNQNGPQTLECAFGLKTDTGEYYAIDFSAMSQIPPPVATGDRISANGLLVPIEQISSDQWRIYPIEGIFSVTDSLKIQK